MMLTIIGPIKYAADTFVFLAMIAPANPKTTNILNSTKSIFFIGVVISLFPLISILNIY